MNRALDKESIYTRKVERLPKIMATHSEVNSVQEACIKCIAVHILKFEILQKQYQKTKQKTSKY